MERRYFRGTLSATGLRDFLDHQSVGAAARVQLSGDCYTLGGERKKPLVLAFRGSLVRDRPIDGSVVLKDHEL